jgi:hypothetical protein
MANGTELSWLEFRKLEEPLRDMDYALHDFAERIGAEIEANYHARPSRTILVRTTDGIDRSIHIFPSKQEPDIQWSEKNTVYLFRLGAEKRDRRQTFGWDRVFKKLSRLPKNKKEQTQLLEQCWKKIVSVEEKDLIPSA